MTTTQFTAPRAPAGLLALARQGLVEAEQAGADGLRYAAAHLAALRAAAAVTAARTSPTRTRRDPAANVWKLLAATAPEYQAWAEHFDENAVQRAAVEAGIPQAVTARQADDMLRAAGQFVELVASEFGITHHTTSSQEGDRP